MSDIIHPFDPIVDKNSKILILGSFPSVISRENNFYYANKTNRFWPVMETLFHTELIDKQSKIEFCLANKIALWDVIKSCKIHKSSDSSIRDVVVNRIDLLIEDSSIELLVFNGKKAYDLFLKSYKTLEIKRIVLPSTSSANASTSFDKLLEEYSKIKEVL